jgi:pectinesterase
MPLILAFGMKSLLLSLFLPILILGGSDPPPGALVVGTGGQFRTVQSAVDAAQPGQRIFIKPGTYHEQVFVQKPNITIIGASSNTRQASSNTVTITNNKAQDNGLNNDQTGTLRAHGSNFRLYNINLLNTRGRGSQALALSAYGDRQGYYACQFRGFQDTVLSEKGKHLFVDSIIEGATDFIFGMHGEAWFERCEIHATAPGFITANGRDSASNPSFFVFSHCSIDGPAGAGKTFLGRPWRAYARVVFQNSRMSSVVSPAGWSVWNVGDVEKERISNVYFGEYQNEGPGAQGKRAAFGRMLEKPVPMNQILPGVAEWVDREYNIRS